MSADRLHLLGIRHHGPGSAASVLDALEAADPALVLIEGPPDAGDILHFAKAPGMRPPLALLVHAADDPARALFYPFAEYSPEWQAMLWALARGREVRFIDLPAAAKLAEEPDSGKPESADESEEGEREPKEDDGETAALFRDPLGVLAAAAGESDGEAWWNALVEQSANSRDVFPVIADAMTAVREVAEASGPPLRARERLREDRREAHMRLAIRDALKETDKAVAVVCGAWHVPALRRDVPAKDDRETLKGLPKLKTTATWVPWTDTRLAARSGYGAGVISPGWYRHLWRARRAGAMDVAHMTARWQTDVAGLLRGEGLSAAPASVIEATRLAVSLAAVRGFAVPGLVEMQDASLSVLCQGEPALLKLIGERLVIGTEIGEIDESVPRMPLLADLERWQKRLRLKPSTAQEEIALDLRSEAGLLKSTLLHRLLLIDLPWGRKMEAAAGRGTFRETWLLAWSPEFSVKLAEALRFGATIEQAASGAALEQAAKATGPAELAALVEACLHADLPAAAAQATDRLQALAVSSGDLAGLLRAAAPLANVLRYGTARKIPVEELTRLVASMSAEICVGLPHACRSLDADATAAMHQAMRAFDSAVSILQDEHQQAEWQKALRKLTADDQVAAFLRGYAVRRLHDRNVLVAEACADALSRALSPSVPAADAGAWLEGFLSEAAQLLLHDPALFGLIDRWLLDLDEEAFVNLLPGLRRALGGLDLMERRRLLEQLARTDVGAAPALSGEDERAETAFAAALPLLTLILGLDADEREPAA